MAIGPSTSCILFLCLSAYFCFLMSALGVTAGAHRLWSHRSYKAKLPLRLFLAAANSMAFQVGFWLPVQILGLQETFSSVQSSPQLRGSRRKKNLFAERYFLITDSAGLGCRAPFTTHITVCIRQSRSNNYLRTELNVPGSEAAYWWHRSGPTVHRAT